MLTIQRDEFQLPITISDQPDLLEIPQVYQKKLGNFWTAVDQDQVALQLVW
ncbi:MAG: hypothetical protein ACFBSC_16505 [Microcoleaceae cyanobacterium]